MSPAIIGALVGMVLSLLSSAGVAVWLKIGASSVVNAAVAGQAVMYSGAAQRYVQDNGSTIAASTSATVGFTITTAMLQAGGYLPSGWNGGNPWGQGWQAQVLQPSAGNLETLVTTTGGVAISDPKQLIQIAAQMGAQGGYIPTSNMLGNAAYNTTTAFGSFGGWTLPMAGFANPGSGHIASLLAFSSVQSSNGYLYRVAVAGQPQLNAMQTDLSLTDVGGTKHNIAGANNITAAATVAADNVTASGNVSAAGILSASLFTTDASGRIGTNGYATTALPGGWGGGVATGDVYAHGTVAAGANGAIATSMNAAGVLTAATGAFSVSSAGVVSIGSQGSSGTGCSGTGGFSTITSDSAGVPLECIAGVWRPVGGRMQKFGFYSASDGTVIPAPSCPATASEGALVTMSNIYIDSTASASYYSSGTGPWTVLIRDGSNTPIPGGTAQVETYCVFN